MTRALDLTQRQVRALCAAAKKEGYAPIIQVGKTTIRLVPEDRIVPAQENGKVDVSGNDFLDAELAAFEAEHGDG